ncbi:MAG: oligosaccharide flippase family protein [Sphingomonas sp.]|nr:oligosaccharide flippase family protein [Sphingomonas sp.]
MIGKIPREMIVRLSWTTMAFGVIQVLRLVNNVVLARLLSPPLLGLMLIVNSIRTGVELLSDVGINQNIVSNRQGHTPEFYDTAWTIMAIRGVVLGAACFALAGFFARFFDKPDLRTILPVIALTFVFTGFQSASSALLQKQGSVARISAVEVGVAVISLAAHVALALITPTIWALVLGSVITSAASLVASYLIIPGVRHRFILDRASAREIIFFGKWIFLSSIIYFLAMNYDRLYFAKQIPLALLGVYAIARSMADMLTSLVDKTGNMVLFPHVASMQSTAPEVRARLLHSRRTMLLLVAIGLAGMVAVSDAVIRLLYDSRYETAAEILPLLLLGVWVAILCKVNDSVLLGMARPAYTAIANGAKLLTFVVGIPFAFLYYGLMGAIVVLNAGEVVRYVVLWLFSRRKHLAFGRDDLALTIFFLIAVVGIREVLSRTGLTSGIEALFPVLRPEMWAR